MLTKFVLIFFLPVIVFCRTANAGQTLEFESIVSDAIANSYELKISKHDTEVKKSIRTQALLSLFPEISVSMNSAFSEQLKDKQNYFFSEDNEFSSDNQRYGNVLSVDLNYTLLDYGQSSNQFKIGTIDENIARVYQFEVLKNLKLQILSIFSQALTFHEEKKLNKEKLSIYDEMIENSEETAKSGVTGSLDLIMHQRKKLEIEYDNLNLNKQIEENLEDLTFFTGQKYRINDVRFVGLNCESKLFLEFDYKRQPEFLRIIKEIEKKKIELSIIKAEFFPKIDLKAGYKYYGTDPEKYDKSFKDIDDESYSVGLFTTVALFKTVKNYYAYKSGKHEVLKTEVMLAQKAAELNNQFNIYKKEYQSLVKVIDLDKKKLSLVDQNLKMLNRLGNEGLIDRKEILEQKILLIDEKIRIKKDIISKSSAMKRFEILVKEFI